jgi:hypothetical protein
LTELRNHHPGSVSRMLGAVQRDGKLKKRQEELEKM